MKIKLTKTVELEDCTHEFLSGWMKVENHLYAIGKYEDGTYAIVHNSEVIKEFKEKSKIYNHTWLLTLLDDTQCIMYYTENKIRISEPFLSLICVFESLVLIESLEGERKLLYSNNFSEEQSWISGLDDYKILQLPNGRKTILKKEGLEVLDFEFDDYVFSAHIKNIVIIVKDGQESLIRISDFKQSEYYSDITCYNASDKQPIDVVEYAIITYSDEKKALMRVENFEVSDRFDSIKPISYEYAFATNNGRELILRLSDFQIAKFDEI